MKTPLRSFPSPKKCTFSAALVMLVGVSLVGCGGGKKAEAAADACEEFVDTLIDRSLECGEELGLSFTREQLEGEARSAMDCDDARDIRNENEFYDDCLPQMEVLDCDDLLASRVPDSCEDQILF